MSSIQDQAEAGIRAAQEGAQQAIDQIPPEAWPMIDLMFRITIGLAIVWLILSLIGWWRRRAYNLTIASTAKANKKAQPDFLSVDEKARKEAVDRGRGHEETLSKREADEALATLKAAKEPITWASRIASAATFVMSLFTLLTGFSGAIFGVKRLGGYVEDATTSGQIEYVLREHTIGCAVVAFVIGYHIWRFIAEEKWKKA